MAHMDSISWWLKGGLMGVYLRLGPHPPSNSGLQRLHKDLKKNPFALVVTVSGWGPSLKPMMGSPFFGNTQLGSGYLECDLAVHPIIKLN